MCYQTCTKCFPVLLSSLVEMLFRCGVRITVRVVHASVDYAYALEENAISSVEIENVRRKSHLLVNGSKVILAVKLIAFSRLSS